MELHGLRALVMGLGVHGGGVGVARFLAQRGAAVTVTDLRSHEQLADSVASLAGLPIRFVLGEHREVDFRDAQLVVRNPAVPDSSRFLQIARESGATIEMEMSLFFRLCPAPILGVTGTKGKTTTTLLLAAMLGREFPGTIAAGNLRVSALDQLPLLTPQTPVVLELSSYALEGLGAARLSPPFALWTNLSSDHLDRYADLAAYAEAKAQIFRHQTPDGVVVLNADDWALRALARSAPGRVAWFAAEGGAAAESAAAHGATMVYGAGGVRWLTESGALPICAAVDSRLPGMHNLANIAAAAALATIYGVSPAAIRAAVRDFGGVPHRLETVRELDGVVYINDTTATAPEAAIAALLSMTRPMVAICGGADKNLPFGRMAETLAVLVRAVVLLEGTATPALASALAYTGAAPPVYGPFGDFAAAVALARSLARPGDAVLLAPGCASFGMFRNEFHRGEEFRRIVGQLGAVEAL